MMEHHKATVRNLYSLSGINRVHLLLEDDITGPGKHEAGTNAMLSITGKPEIISKVVESGRYQWEILVPVEHLFSHDDGTFEQAMLMKEEATLKVLLIRSQDAQNSFGLAIDNIHLETN